MRTGLLHGGLVIRNPYERLHGGRWLRGNLHTHTTLSDGQREPQDVVDDYATRGYDFLGFSDHDVLPDRLDALADHGMTLLVGNEITGTSFHVGHHHAAHRVPPYDDRQRVIDEINGSQGFAILNHPNWRYQGTELCPLSAMQSLQGYLGMEIFNGVVGRLEGSSLATDKWDLLLGAGRRVWGFANDDSHEAVGDVGLGWNVVYAADRSPEALAAAMQHGCFYASTGVTITDINVDRDRIRVATANASRLVAVTDYGRRLLVADAPEIEVVVLPEVTYVRIECYGAGEQMAWTQPFLVDRR